MITDLHYRLRRRRGLSPVALDQSWSRFYFPVLLIYQCSLCAPCRPISSKKTPASGFVKDRQLRPHSLFLHLVCAFLDRPTTSEPTVPLLVLLLALSSLPTFCLLRRPFSPRFHQRSTSPTNALAYQIIARVRTRSAASASPTPTARRLRLAFRHRPRPDS